MNSARNSVADVQPISNSRLMIFGISPRFAFEPRDHFVVPSWHSVRFEAPEDAVLFSFSDRPVQQALGILREQRLETQ